MAAFCPPEHVIAEVRLAVTAAEQASVPTLPELPGRRRWFGGKAAAPPLSDPVPMVTGWSDGLIPIVRFGNLTSSDAMRVADALLDAAGDWEPTEVYLEALSLDPLTPNLVRAHLGGGVEPLMFVAKSVATVAASLNLYLDRRLFQAELDVACITPDTSEARRNGLGDALAEFAGGQTWTVDYLSVLRQSFGTGSSQLVESNRIALGSDQPTA